MTRRTHRTRTSDERWGCLFLLLRGFEQAIEVSSRLDAFQPQFDAHGNEIVMNARHYAQHVSFESRLRGLEARIDHEFDRLTSDRLRLDLTRKLAVA